MPIKILNGIDVDNGVLYTDTSNNRVGINASSPQVPLEVKHGGPFIDEIIRIVGETSGKPQLTFYNGTALHTKIVAAGNDDFSISNLRAAGDMFFQAGGANRLHIEANGNVGIGVSSPSTKLEVVDTFSVQRTSTDNEGFYVTVHGADANAIVETFYQEDSSSMYGIRKRYDGSTNLYQEFIHDNSATGTEIYRVDRGTKNTSIANGNVGIGTTSPTNSKLEVVGEIDANGGDGYRIEGKPWANWGSDLLTLGDWDGEGYATRIMGSNSSEVMRVTGTSVGIGTTTPTAPLHIEGGTNSEVLKIEANANPYARWVQNGTNVGFLQFSSTNAYLSNESNGSFFFRTNSTDKMTITSTGNVGIGTTAPGAKLEVNGNTRIVGSLQLYQGSTSNQYLTFSQTFGSTFINTGTSGETIFIGAPTAYQSNLQLQGDFIVRGGSSSTSIQTKTSLNVITNKIVDSGISYFNAGNVGIGTTSPSEKLEVNGHIKAVDGYKGYVSHFHSGGFDHSPRSQDGANPFWIPSNYVIDASSDQYYNIWVPLYAGRIRKIIFKNTTGTPTATVCTFYKRINGTTSISTYAGTVTGGGASGMKVTVDFGTSNFTFNAEDEIQIGFVTGVATQPSLRGVSYQIWYEYNIT